MISAPLLLFLMATAVILIIFWQRAGSTPFYGRCSTSSFGKICRLEIRHVDDSRHGTKRRRAARRLVYLSSSAVLSEVELTR